MPKSNKLARWLLSRFKKYQKLKEILKNNIHMKNQKINWCWELFLPRNTKKKYTTFSPEIFLCFFARNISFFVPNFSSFSSIKIAFLSPEFIAFFPNLEFVKCSLRIALTLLWSVIIPYSWWRQETEILFLEKKTSKISSLNHFQ